MKEYYQDIRDRIKEEPSWYDENGVPRYGEHRPDLCPDIYADEIVLLEIACQDCAERFKVQMSTSVTERALKTYRDERNRISDAIRMWKRIYVEGKFPPIHYGDPPAHGCVGDTMNCYDLRVLELWHKNEKFEWVRIQELEIELEKEG